MEVAMDQIKIGRFIAELRKNKNMTQHELADILGVTNRTVSRWENGNYMPDLSLITPISETLDVSVSELLKGEHDTNNAIQHEDVLIQTLDYATKKIKEKTKIMSIVLLALGSYLIWTSVSPWMIGIGIGFLFTGFISFSKTNQKPAPIILFLTTIFIFLFAIDYYNSKNKITPPKLALQTHSHNAMLYQTPFYNYFIINPNTHNKYSIFDQKKTYSLSNVPVLPFNYDNSNIANLLKYEHNYIGNNTNTINLLNNLPLSEYGFVIEIDSNNFGVKVNYAVTDWYINHDHYIEKSLLYNTASFFSLIKNAEYITFSFSGNSFSVTRNNFETHYPNNLEIITNNHINVDAFNKFVTEKLDDSNFVEATFKQIFHLNS